MVVAVTTTIIAIAAVVGQSARPVTDCSNFELESLSMQKSSFVTDWCSLVLIKLAVGLKKH